MTLICLGVQGIYPTSDLNTFWHGCLVASEVNFGLWPLLLGLIEYFQNSSQTIHNYAIPVHFGLLEAPLAFYHYFGFSECVRFSIISIPLFKALSNESFMCDNTCHDRLFVDVFDVSKMAFVLFIAGNPIPVSVTTKYLDQLKHHFNWKFISTQIHVVMKMCLSWNEFSTENDVSTGPCTWW